MGHASRRIPPWLIAGVVVVLAAATYGGWRVLPRLASLVGPACADSGTPAVPASPAPSSSPPQPGSAGSPGPSLPPGPAAGTALLRVPVLMYHEIREDANPADPDYQMTPSRFAAQLCTLAARGWRAITADELGMLLASGGTPPARTMVLTFDDGTAGHYASAFPLLRRYGFPATFFVISAFVGTDGYLTWDQARAMRAAGMEIGSHSAHHPQLSQIPLEQAAAEIGEAQRVIGEQTGATPRTLAYPGGLYNDGVVAATRDAGLLAAFTVPRGVRSYGWADRLVIPRINVGAQSSGEQLAWIVESYDR